ncbi:MAG: CpaF/VirB11 family protein [Lachnospiraceae bacterium]|nr:CpaF/VirB11 family protein [Lachnospiraceae bacterium]
MLHRLENMSLSAANIPLPAIRSQVASAIDIVIQLARIRDKTRRVMEISEVIGLVDGEYKLNKLYEFRDYGDDEDGKVKGNLCRLDTELYHRQKLIFAGITISQEEKT